MQFPTFQVIFFSKRKKHEVLQLTNWIELVYARLNHYVCSNCIDFVNRRFLKVIIYLQDKTPQNKLAQSKDKENKMILKAKKALFNALSPTCDENEISLYIITTC